MIAHVVAYIRKLVGIVQPTERVFIAVDGVAPMAKIKQQRMRRFKSAVIAEQEARIRAEALGVPYTSQPRWDTNAITPGTEFMAKLAKALEAMQTDKKIVASSAAEPGEGEQKIMAYVRANNISDTVVYGLDADLIILSLWAEATQGVHMDLFREDVEFGGGVKEDALGEEQFLYLDTSHLAATLHSTYAPAVPRAEFVQDFVARMNLLGNDFVPHEMSLKIRDSGIERLLELHAYPELRKHGAIVYQDRMTRMWQYNTAALSALFEFLAAEEPAHILTSCRKKLDARVGSTNSKEPDVQALARYNDTPVLWAAEKSLVEKYTDPALEKPQWRLRADWVSQYNRDALMGASIREAVHRYLESLGWTLSYYAGQPIDTEWYYPWPLPPRFADIAAFLRDSGAPLPIPTTARTPLTPVEQLAMVLPQGSFHLLPAAYQTLPSQVPYAWPGGYDVYSLGRRFMWECEPLIPLITPTQIRAWTATAAAAAAAAHP